VAVDSEAARSVLGIYWKHPMKPVKTYGDYRQQLIEQLASQMLSLRFREQILNPKTPFAIAIAATFPLMDKTDAFILYAILKKNKAQQAAEELLKLLESAKRYGFSEQELERAKKDLLARIEKAYNEKDKTESNYFVETMHQNFSVRHEPIMSIEQEYEIVKQLLPSISIDDVNKAIKDLAPNKNMVITLT
jgi:zinc protease